MIDPQSPEAIIKALVDGAQPLLQYANDCVMHLRARNVELRCRCHGEVGCPSVGAYMSQVSRARGWLDTQQALRRK